MRTTLEVKKSAVGSFKPTMLMQIMNFVMHHMGVPKFNEHLAVGYRLPFPTGV